MTQQPILWFTLWDQTDFIGKSLLIILMGMSCVTWYLIISKTIMIVQAKRYATNFLITFWNATSLKQVEHELIAHGVRDPFSHLTIHALHAQSHHAQFGANRLE